MISKIGSCRTDLKTNECRDQVKDEVQSSHSRKPLQCKSGGFLSAPPSVVDIKNREANKDTDMIFKFRSSNSEHSQENFPNVFAVGNMPPELGNNFGIKKNISSQFGNSLPSELPFVYSDTHKSVCHSANFSAYTNAATTQNLCSKFATSPVLSDAVSLLSDKESVNGHEEYQVFLSLSQDQACDYISKHQGMLLVCSKSSEASEPQTSGFLSQFPSPGGNITALNSAPSTNLVAPFVVLPARGLVDVDDCAVSGQQYPSLPVNPTTKAA